MTRVAPSGATVADRRGDSRVSPVIPARSSRRPVWSESRDAACQVSCSQAPPRVAFFAGHFGALDVRADEGVLRLADKFQRFQIARIGLLDFQGRAVDGFVVFFLQQPFAFQQLQLDLCIQRRLALLVDKGDTWLNDGEILKKLIGTSKTTIYILI